MSFSNRIQLIKKSPLRALVDIVNKRNLKVHFLNIGQPDIESPKEFNDAVNKFNKKTVSYAHSRGDINLINSWKDYFLSRDINIESNDLIVTAGASEALLFSMVTICDPGDEIIVFEPFYPNYASIANMVNVKIVPIERSDSDSFNLPSEEEIEKYISSKTKAILLCNPCNPTGKIYSSKEINKLGKIIKKYNLFLIADEVYSIFTYESKFISALMFDEIKNNVIVIESLSKSLNLCGARIGCVVSRNKGIIESILKLAMARLSISTVDQLAVIPVLENYKNISKTIISISKERRDVMCRELEKINGVSFIKPEAAIYIFATLPIDNSYDFCRWLASDFEYEGETILISPGSGFYLNKDSKAVRIAFVNDVVSIKRSCLLLKIAIDTYNKK